MTDLNSNTWGEKMQADDKAVIIDVRTPMEWNEGIIPEAELLNIMEGSRFAEKVGGMDRSKNYYVYCRSGARSGQACRYMSQLGINCYNLSGGIMAWTGPVVPPS